MRLSILLSLLLFISGFHLNAQDKPSAIAKGESASVAQNLIKVETLLPSILAISYEKKLEQNISLYSSISLLGGFGGGTYTRTFYYVDNYYVLTPQIKVQPRFYHNIAKRAASDKNVSSNAANYIGLSGSFYHTSYFLTNAENYPKGPGVFDLQLSYGWQRSFFKRMNIDLALEPGIEFTSGQASFFIGLNLQLGFIVFSK
ncbi:hypothetical protein SAMN05661096_03097 [Marivirga sericea]|uniref:Outer membrane protein beta-barrel domain-containing protein n=1 Tax=Marivirga sericea TaxID=1028 RepID=A0A1X7KSA8_9BACT|nr:hypothetical protein [Marivirga sericea]SMG44152.1 hypothetical protein SAMN05661096_03097 [Marivirga sericea]